MCWTALALSDAELHADRRARRASAVLAEHTAEVRAGELERLLEAARSTGDSAAASGIN